MCTATNTHSLTPYLGSGAKHITVQVKTAAMIEPNQGRRVVGS